MVYMYLFMLCCTYWYDALNGVNHLMACCTLWYDALNGVNHLMACCTLWYDALNGVNHLMACCTLWYDALNGIHNSMVYITWASLRQNLSSGFPTKRVSNQSPQVQGLARKLKFHL